MNRQKGAATILYVSLTAILAALILSASYSRLLLSLRRVGSMTDTLVVNYDAESEVNDIVSRIVQGYPLSTNYPRTISGTTISLQETTQANTQNLRISARRAFSTSTIEAQRLLSQSASINNAEIILALDCTGSMSDPDSQGVTLFERQRQAALNFINLLQSDTTHTYRLGVILYKINAKWLNPATPGTTTNLQAISGALSAPFNENSPICQGLIENTSIGSAFALSNRYYRTNPPQAGTKRIILTISDGRINSSPPESLCPGTFYCPYDSACPAPGFGWNCPQGQGQFNGGECQTPGLALLRCSLSTNQNGGIRDESTSTYMVTVYAGDENGAEEEIYNDPNYIDAYFNADSESQNGTNLTPILENIFTIIRETSGQITIRKVRTSINP